MAIQPVFNPFSTRPTTATLKNNFALHNLLRDQLHVTTWLVLGALLQGTAHALLPYRNIVLVLPVILVFTYKLANTLLICTGVLPNPHSTNVIPYRAGLIYPDSTGNQQTKVGNQSVCAILLGVVSHSPLGMFAPSFKDVGDRFDEMVREMSKDASRHGFLGASSWINAGERTTSNEYATILYFENEDYLHAYAHGPLHTKTVQWWRETEKEHPSVGIMHEAFAAPKNGWEGVYLNYHPTGLGSTTKETIGPDEQKTWVSPLVRARGKMAYSKGRMGRPVGDKEWEAFSSTLGSED